MSHKQTTLKIWAQKYNIISKQQNFSVMAFPHFRINY